MRSVPSCPPTRRGGVVIGLASTALVAALAWGGGAPAGADTAPTNPADPRTPETVAADALPTVQVNGVVWSQVVVGSTVYAVGKFTRARPAGSPAGSNEVVRNNAVAFDIRTGQMTSWAPSLNAQALAVAASPDGSRIYVGGDFTQVNGAARSRIAALSASNGAMVSAFNTRSDAQVRAIAATSSTVYFGGLTTNVGVSRTRVAAVRASDGGVLPWAPSVTGGKINALAVSPTGSSVVLGGSFTAVNGSSNPGYGLASVDGSNGALQPFAVNATVRNGGSSSAITSLVGDADSVYGTGYTFGGGGNTEGSFRASWSGGTTQWVENCMGDSYSVFPTSTVVYKSSHAHECTDLREFPNRTPTWWNWNGLAFSKAATGVSASGRPAPSLLHWFPQFTNGTVTGQNQATWHVTGNASYVVMAGEFPTVNGAAQQGLVRFATKQLSPNRRGGMLSGSRLNPTVTAVGAGVVQLSWPTNWDQDNRTMTYRVIRDSNTAAPRYTVRADSTFWNQPRLSWQDTGLVPGQAYRYRVFSTDPFGNETRSDTVTVTAR